MTPVQTPVQHLPVGSRAGPRGTFSALPSHPSQTLAAMTGPVRPDR